MTEPTLWSTPAPGASSVGARIMAQAKLEVVLALRNGEQLLLTVVIPVGLLVALALTGTTMGEGGSHLSTADAVGVVLPSVLTIAVLSTAFTGMAIQTGFERRYGVLKRLGATPLTRVQLLAGKALAVAAIELVQIVLLAITAVLLGWHPDVNPAELLVSLVLGTASLAACGLLLAGALRAEATLAVANALYLALLLGGGVLIPISQLPGWWGNVVSLLPSGALAEGLRHAFGTTATEPFALCVAVLGVWTVGAGAMLARWFRWE